MKKLNKNIEVLETLKSKMTLIIFIVLAMISTLCFLHPDIFITTRHSYYLYSHGNFYQNTMNVIVTANGNVTAVYELPLYLIFAVWNFPLYIISKILGHDAFGFYTSDLSKSIFIFKLLWAKILVIIFLFSTSKYIQKISLELGFSLEKAKKTAFIFLISIFTFFPVFIFSQYDIIPLFFIMAGIYHYIRKDKKKFFIYFAIAITLKTYAIFIFLPLLLLIEKKIFKILVNFLLVLSPLIFLKLFLIHDKFYHLSQIAFTNEMLRRLLAATLMGSHGSISIFIMIMFFICLFSYLKYPENDELKIFSIYIPLLVYMSFFSLILYHPQWLIILAPFLCITLAINNTTINRILEVILSVSYLIVSFIIFKVVFSVEIINSYFLPKIYRNHGAQKFQNISEIIQKVYKNEPVLLTLALTLFVSSCIGFLVLNFPKKNWSIKDIEKTEITEKDNLIRLSIPVVLVMLLLFCYYYSG